MKQLMIYTTLIFTLLCSVNLFAQQQRVIKDGVLLNVEPYEVLMTPNGDILSKIRHLPDYLKSLEKIERQFVNTELASREVKREVPGTINTKELTSDEVTQDKLNENEVVPFAAEAIPKTGHYEVIFSKGTATLTSLALNTLNKLAEELKQNPDQRIQVFGFKNESPMVASLLAKRRQDACVAYLRIKGVDVDNQVSKGSVTQGTSNKIVFGFE